MSPQPLAARMKAYEHTFRAILPRRSYCLLRVDGRAFHSLTRDFDRPFDTDFASDLDAVALALCKEITGARLAFVQSDEVSVLFTDLDSIGSEPWMGGVVAKVVSLSAALASVTFNLQNDRNRGAVFDSRVWSLTDPVEVANYLIWRQRDAVKNSISMAASAHFTPGRLDGLNSNQRQELLWQEADINWNDFAVGLKRGRVAVRRTSQRSVGSGDGATPDLVTRRGWEIEDAPQFGHDPEGLLRQVIPVLGWDDPGAI